MSTLVHFKRTLNDLNLEKVKQQADRSWLSSQTMPTEIVDVLTAEVERLRRELHDERVRRDEWEKMYNQAIAGTEVEQLQERLKQAKTTLDHEVDSRVCAELEVERLQSELKLHKELSMSLCDVISTKVTQEGNRTTFTRIFKGQDGTTWPDHRTWVRIHGWHCPKCGENNLVATRSVSEYNAGYQHVCLSCGFGFMFTGDEYLGISEKSRDDLVAHLNENRPL